MDVSYEKLKLPTHRRIICKSYIYVCMYICIYVCMYVCMDVCMHACTHARMHTRPPVRLHVCVHARTHACHTHSSSFHRLFLNELCTNIYHFYFINTFRQGPFRTGARVRARQQPAFSEWRTYAFATRGHRRILFAYWRMCL